MTTIKVNKDDLITLLDYIVILDEEKDYEENCKPKNHIWLVAKRLMKQSNYKK